MFTGQAIYAFLLAYADGLVTGARLGCRFGFGRLFVWGIAIFTVGSLACGLAADAGMLVAARTAQGAGAALVVPWALSLLRVTFHGERRRRATSAYWQSSPARSRLAGKAVTR